jgi:hypothetical protein
MNLNPCKSCIQKFQNDCNGDCNVTDINNCCYETLSAFYGDSAKTKIEAENCKNCVLNVLKQEGPFPGGYTFCDKNISPPPIFYQVPHYIPQLLKDGYTPEEAKIKCMMLCDSGATKYPNECKEYCMTDFNAIEVTKESYSSQNNYHYVPPLRINMSYNESLRLSQPYYYNEEVIVPGGKISDIQTLHYAIAPLNTDIRFKGIVPIFQLSKNSRLQAVMDKPLPEVFDWVNSYSTDDKVIKQKKKLISPVMNQGMCGSCWSVSSAQVMSDNFVVSGIVNFSPNISPTWPLSKTEYSQGRCDGGNPADLFIAVVKGGIVDNHCIDYSWCSTNLGTCVRGPKGEVIGGNLDSTIPPEGCYYDADHYLYFVDSDVQTIAIDDKLGQDEFRQIVKQHIYNHGPVLAGFFVFANFMSGAHTKINNGIYFESGVYDGSGQIKFDPSQATSDNYVGAHAVAVLGWGIAKNTVVDNNGKKEDVPYWFTRNSWDTTWGNKGYFKMAMYPYNKYSQFCKSVDLESPRGNLPGLGGMVIINTTKKPEKQKIGQLPKSYLDKKLPRLKTKYYYENESDNIRENSVMKDTSSDSNNLPLIIGIGFVLFILILLFVSTRRR